MNPEMFHDALNHIDDDMILAVEKLRHKKKSKVNSNSALGGIF